MKKMLSLIVVLVLVMCCGFEACLAASGIPGLEPNTMILEMNGQTRTFELYTHQLNDDNTVFSMYVCTDDSGDATGINLVTTLGTGVYTNSTQLNMISQFAIVDGGAITLMADCGSGDPSHGTMDFCLYVSDVDSHYCGVFFVDNNGTPIKGMFDLTIK